MEQTVSLRLAGPSGLEIAATGLRLADTVAGDGLAIINKVLSIGVAGNSGLVTAADSLALGTPGVVSASSVSAVVGSGHTHAVVAASNAKSSPGQLVKSDVSGDSIWRWLTADKLVAPLIESLGEYPAGPGQQPDHGRRESVVRGGAADQHGHAGSLTLAPAAGLILDPADDVGTDQRRLDGPDGALEPAAFWGRAGGDVPGEGIPKADGRWLHVAAFDRHGAGEGGAEVCDAEHGDCGAEFRDPGRERVGHAVCGRRRGSMRCRCSRTATWLLLRVVDRAAGGLNVTNASGAGVGGMWGLPDGNSRGRFPASRPRAQGRWRRQGRRRWTSGKERRRVVVDNDTGPGGRAVCGHQHVAGEQPISG